MAAGDNITFDEDINFSGAVRFTGTIPSLPATIIDESHLKSSVAIPRSDLAQDNLQVVPIELTSWRVWNAPQTNLPGTAASDDLGLIYGTFATGSDLIQTSDSDNTSVTQYARAMVTIPYNYQSAETVNFRAYAGMEGDTCSVSCTLDCECYEVDGSGGISADLCTTSATSINSLTYANTDFVITATALAPGDVLDIRITIATNDSGAGTSLFGSIGKTYLLIDLKG